MPRTAARRPAAGAAGGPGRAGCTAERGADQARHEDGGRGRGGYGLGGQTGEAPGGSPTSKALSRNEMSE
jgi:hypothetical protein